MAHYKKMLEQNNKERMKFVEFWAEYVSKTDDKTWSRQQNIIINSALQSACMTKEQYLEMKGELQQSS